VDEDEDSEQFLKYLAFVFFWIGAMHGAWICYERMDGRTGGFWNRWKQAWMSSHFYFGIMKTHLG
jgi:hypothetical protein